MSAEWITDRPPTEADGDPAGHVRIPCPTEINLDHFRLVHWSYVGIGVSWRHTSLWRPPAEPIPTEPGHAPESAREEHVEPDRIIADCRLPSWLEERLSALEGVTPDGVVPVKVPGGLPALEQRLAKLEQLFWTHKHETRSAVLPAPSDPIPEAQP